MEIKNQVALITGAASGLGAATLKYLAEQQAKVVGIDTNLEALQKQAKDFDALCIKADICNTQDVQTALDKTQNHYGTMPRICINCAGIAPAARIVGKENIHDLDMFSKVIQVNLIGTFNIVRLVAKHMTTLIPLEPDQERGIIINTASIAAMNGQIGQAAYSASKGGISSLTQPAAKELAQFGIRVVAIAPGIFSTPLIQNMSDKVQTQLAQDCIFPKRFGLPQEYSQFVGTLIKNSMLNGQTYRLDGAYQMR